MMLRIKSAQDFGAGVLFALVGFGALWFGRALEVGSAAQMGPGYFPVMLGYGLLVFGAIFVLRGLAYGGPPIEASRWRPPLAILAAITAFSLLIERAGLATAVAACVLVSMLALPRTRWWEALALAVLLAAFCVAVFIYGLGQSITVFGGG
jgi:hypothetical protein